MIRHRLILPSFLPVILLASEVTGQSSARLVGDLNRSPGDFTAAIEWLVPVEHGVVFTKDDLATGKELWISDGTARGTRLLKDLRPGSAGSYPERALRIGNKAAFRAFDDQGSEDIWLTDGSVQGTIKWVDAPPDQVDSSQITPLVGTPDGLFYEVYSWNSGDPTGLWFAGVSGSGPLELNPFNSAGTERERFGNAYGFAGDESRCFFLANDTELWRSDGTVAGTLRVADLGPLIGDGWPERLSVAAGRVMVHWYREWGHVELWSCTPDGDDLERLAPDPGIDWRDIRSVAGHGRQVIFHTRDQDDRSRLWISNGTGTGTRELPLEDGSGKWLEPGFEFVEWNGAVYFSVSGGVSGGLWRTDGTREGTGVVKSSFSSSANPAAMHLIAGPDDLHFQLPGPDGWELWRIGTTATTARRVCRLHDQNPYMEGSLAAPWKGSLLFAAGRGTTGNALWKTRPRGAGATRLTRPEKSTASSFTAYPPATPYETLDGSLLTFVREAGGIGAELWRLEGKARMTVPIWRTPATFGYDGSVSFRHKLGQLAVFSVSGTDVRQVWATDGSRRGTRLLADHSGGYFGKFAMAGGTLFYQVIAGSDAADEGLWKTDGTPAGTSRVVDVDGAPVMVEYDEMVDFGGVLHFVAVAPDGKKSLWRSDGTPLGTVMIKDWWGTSGENSPGGLAVIGNRLSVTLTLPLTQSLWTSDGTGAGTHPVQSGFHGNTLREIGPSHDLGGLQVFHGRGRTIYHPLEWWRSDGTDAGTFPVLPGLSHQHLYPAIGNSGVIAGSKILYTGLELVEDDLEAELWITDGTATGTYKLKDIEPGPDGSNPTQFVAAGNMAYFVAGTREHGLEVWCSDGTEQGTRLLADVEPGSRSSSPSDLKVLDGKLYFHAHRGATGRELYVVDLPGAP